MINENLKNLRKQNKLSQEDISKILNISQSAYSKYEVGLAEPDLTALKKLSDLYKISIDALIKDNVTIISQGGNMENRSLTSEEENALNIALNKTENLDKFSKDEMQELRNIINWFKQLRK